MTYGYGCIFINKHNRNRSADNKASADNNGFFADSFNTVKINHLHNSLRCAGSKTCFIVFINLGTIDAMLADLMKNGLKINGGDSLGKTIIFAASHLEAEKIVERFGVLYPYHSNDYCKLIDSQVADSLSLIDSFGERGQLPQIAVSVDMMDTGIDVPDVLNLVFFKKVRSYSKFWQMIGRGTRLCKDLLGIGQDKEKFLIFDFCNNFEYS